MVCYVSTVCIFSMTLITYTYLSNMACPNGVVSWANTVCVHWTGHDALVSVLINNVATPPIVTSWIDIISLTFSFNHDHVISILNFPVSDLCHDSIGNKLFGFVFSRSDEPIVIGVCGMRLVDQDHRIVSEPIASGSFLESGPAIQGYSSSWYHSLSRCMVKTLRWTSIRHWFITFTLDHIAYMSCRRFTIHHAGASTWVQFLQSHMRSNSDVGKTCFTSILSDQMISLLRLSQWDSIKVGHASQCCHVKGSRQCICCIRINSKGQYQFLLFPWFLRIFHVWFFSYRID